jgi:hypothetical protein
MLIENLLGIKMYRSNLGISIAITRLRKKKVKIKILLAEITDRARCNHKFISDARLVDLPRAILLKRRFIFIDETIICTRHLKDEVWSDNGTNIDIGMLNCFDESLVLLGVIDDASVLIYEIYDKYIYHKVYTLFMRNLSNFFPEHSISIVQDNISVHCHEMPIDLYNNFSLQ